MTESTKKRGKDKRHSSHTVLVHKTHLFNINESTNSFHTILSIGSGSSGLCSFWDELKFEPESAWIQALMTISLQVNLKMGRLLLSSVIVLLGISLQRFVFFSSFYVLTNFHNQCCKTFTVLYLQVWEQRTIFYIICSTNIYSFYMLMLIFTFNHQILQLLGTMSLAMLVDSIDVKNNPVFTDWSIQPFKSVAIWISGGVAAHWQPAEQLRPDCRVVDAECPCVALRNIYLFDYINPHYRLIHVCLVHL